MSTNNALLTIDEYRRLKPDERVSYICNILNLKENYLIGTVKSRAKILSAESLINPYSGKYILERIIQDSSQLDNAMLGSIEKFQYLNLEEGQLILFQFSTNRMQDHQIRAGRTLTIIPNSIIPIESTADILRELQLSEDEVFEYANKDNKLDFDHIYYISDFYHEIVFNKLKEMQDQLDKAKKLFEAEQHAVQEEIETTKQALQKEREEFEKQKEELNQIVPRLERLGFTFSKQRANLPEEKLENTLDIPEDEYEFLKQIQQQLLARNFTYHSDTLRKFYFALKTNQLVILSGPSGTGKTSLIENFAKVTSSKAKMIPVQPSWTDKQDLLGFYNPIQKQFIPTVFLDALIEAKEHKDKLYLICLDEMNLAQIEYYLADILSVREQKNPEIELYSSYEYEQNREEVKWYIDKVFHSNDEKIETIEHFTYIQREKNLNRYPGKIQIPPNVRIIGTMNIDGTVRPLSPKVVDRSFVIHVDRQKDKIKQPENKGVFNLIYTQFMKNANETNNRFRTIINNRLGPYLKDLDAHFNYRVQNHIDNYTALIEKLPIDEQQKLDDIITMKVLPRINYLLEKDTNAHIELLRELSDLVGEDKESYKKVNDMINDARKTSIFAYWS